jgi:hypothetical protein
MTSKLPVVFFAVGLTIDALIGCAPQPEAFLTIEICLKNSVGVAAFKQELQSMARSQGLILLDGSAQTEGGLDAISTAEQRKAQGRPVINMTVRLEDDIVVVIGNLGLPSGQAVVAFYDNPGALDERQFAQMVVARLEQRWRTKIVPPGTGAQGMSDCT